MVASPTQHLTKQNKTAALRDNEGDIDLTDNDINVSDLGDALDQLQEPARAPSPDTPEPPSPAGSEDTASPAQTRRNTMSRQGQPSGSAPPADNTVPVQPTIEGNTRRPKIKESDVFRGERSKLREWLAQMKVYFRLVGWAEGHDMEKIVYTTSLLRGSAGTWITPYIEDLKQPTWTRWPQFAEELQNQFSVIDRKGEARNRLKNITQGKRTMTEYWNEFRLVSSEAELDDATEGEWLLAGMTTTLQNA